MFPIAPLFRQSRARGTLFLAVAVVHDRMVAVVPPGTCLITRRWSGSAGHWRGDRHETAVACQIVEGHIVTRMTVATVTLLFASVLAARQQLSTDERASVINVDAAVLAALVSAAGPLLVAPFLASGVVRSRLEVRTGELAVHEAAPACHL